MHICINLYIHTQIHAYINHHHHHVMLSARIFLTLFCHTSLLSSASGRSSRLHPVSAQSCCKFELNVLFLLVHVKGSIGAHLL